MFSLEIEIDAERRDWLIAELYDLAPAGIVELDERKLRVFFEDGADRLALAARYPDALLREEEDRDWVAAAQELIQPMAVGERFFLVPAWRDDPTPAGRLRMTVNPGMAFGTGVHETTRLCLEALEEFARPGVAVLDVGTGSGILARAARLLSAGPVFACDTDPVAIEIAGEGFIGSANAVRNAAFDLVVANISPEAIIALAPEFERVLRQNGVLLVSGFEAHEAALVQAALPRASEVRIQGAWALVVA